MKLSGWPVLTRLVAGPRFQLLSTRLFLAAVVVVVTNGRLSPSHAVGPALRHWLGVTPGGPLRVRLHACQHPRRSLTLAIIALLLVIGCGKKPPVVAPTVVREVVVQEVNVPVPFKVQPPPELLSALSIPLPLFVAPSDPMASSALTAEGERLLRGMIEELLQRIAAWQAWAEAK